MTPAVRLRQFISNAKAAATMDEQLAWVISELEAGRLVHQTDSKRRGSPEERAARDAAIRAHYLAHHRWSSQTCAAKNIAAELVGKAICCEVHRAEIEAIRALNLGRPISWRQIFNILSR